MWRFDRYESEILRMSCMQVTALGEDRQEAEGSFRLPAMQPPFRTGDYGPTVTQI
jgi:hypothetical protein